MTYQDDPNINRRPVRDTRSNTPMWIAGLAALALVIGLIAWGSSDKTNSAATNTRPAATSTTTGAGSSSLPNNPNGTTPQRDVNQPVAPPSGR